MPKLTLRDLQFNKLPAQRVATTLNPRRLSEAATGSWGVIFAQAPKLLQQQDKR